MALGVLNNISSIYAQNNLNQTQKSLQSVLQQLSSGSRINSGADDAAGLSLADGLHANATALTQSSQNANSGVGMLQTADGALAQVTNLLDRAITLATEAANGTLNSTQVSSANQEYQNILTEIGNIGSTTNYNGNKVFSSSAVNIVVSDGTTAGTTTFAETVGVLTKTSVGTTGTAGAGVDLTTNANLTATTATAILNSLTTAVGDVAYQRGAIGANINQLNAAQNVADTQQVNLSSAENDIRATNYGQATSDMAKFQVLSQTGIAALSQANAVQQDILKLLQ
ncbi:MAG TPA: flagellin [Edaphobacter sp.]